MLLLTSGGFKSVTLNRTRRIDQRVTGWRSWLLNQRGLRTATSLQIAAMSAMMMMAISLWLKLAPNGCNAG